MPKLVVFHLDLVPSHPYVDAQLDGPLVGGCRDKTFYMRY